MIMGKEDKKKLQAGVKPVLPTQAQWLSQRMHGG